MKTAWLAVLSFLLATTLGFADSFKSEFDKAADFSQIKTYAFKSGLLMLGQDYDLINERLFSAFRNELNAKGMIEVKENPDVYVTYYGVLGGKTASKNPYSPSQDASYDWGAPPAWNGVLSATVIQGSLLIEMANASTKHLVWRVTCQGVVKNLGKPEKQAERIREIVNKAFKSYPPGGKK
jgi:hypothetical protein